MASTVALTNTQRPGGDRCGGARDALATARQASATRRGDGDAEAHLNAVKHSLGFILNLNSDPMTTGMAALTHAIESEIVSEARPRQRVAATPAVPTSPMNLRSRQLDPSAPRKNAQETPFSDTKIAQTPPRARSATRQSAGKAKPPQARGKAKRATAKVAASAKGAKEPLTYAQKRLARKCTVADCTNYTINKGLCFRHGGGKKCTLDGCNASAKISGLCWKHGGSVQCIIEGCDRRGKSRGLCWAHGGGTKCQHETCEKVAVSNGFCWAHGGGKRCHFDGCQRPAYERTLNYCLKHFKKFENGEEVLEL